MGRSLGFFPPFSPVPPERLAISLLSSSYWKNHLPRRAVDVPCRPDRRDKGLGFRPSPFFFFFQVLPSPLYRDQAAPVMIFDVFRSP